MAAGFPILGLGGVLGDVGGALFCSTAMPNLARRLWLISRESKIRTTTNGKYTIDNLGGFLLHERIRGQFALC